MSKSSNMKSKFTKSANALNAHAVERICKDDSVDERIAKNYATIIAQLRSMSAMNEKQFAYAETLNYDVKQISELGKAESREFYKRLRAFLSAVNGQTYKDTPLSLFALNARQNGTQDAYSYAELRSMFGHATNAQAGYFARFLRTAGLAKIDSTQRGNNQDGYKLIPDWNAQALKDLIK